MAELKVYTQTICPKCMLLKNSLTNAGIIDKVTFINIDEHEEIRDWLRDPEKSGNSFTGLPLLHVGDTFYHDSTEIMKVVNDA